MFAMLRRSSSGWRGLDFRNAFTSASSFGTSTSCASKLTPSPFRKTKSTVAPFVRQRLAAELRAQEIRKLVQHRVRSRRRGFHRLREQPAPAFAVGLRIVPAFRHMMENRRAVFVHRRASRCAAVAVEAVLVV